ncbi:MAG: TssN family type VI secretion system protein [Chitinophagaceae bacterium]
MNNPIHKNIISEEVEISEARQRRSGRICMALIVVSSILLGLITTSPLSLYLHGNVLKALQLFGFAGLGMLYASALKNRAIRFHKHGTLGNNKFIFTVLLSLVITVVLLILYFLTDSNMIRMAYASACSFLLPYTIQQSWHPYTNVPEKRFKVWYNSDLVMDTRTTVFLNSLPVRISVTRKYFDITDELYEVTVPGHVPFGKYFNQFVIEKNKSNTTSIECFDQEKKPYGWQFYIHRLGGLSKQFIDPDLSLRENNLRDNSIILAKRKKQVQNNQNEQIQAAAWKPAAPKINTPINNHETGK